MRVVFKGIPGTGSVTCNQRPKYNEKVNENTKYAHKQVKINPPMYPSQVLVGRSLFKGVLPNGTPIKFVQIVFTGTHSIGNITQ